MEHGKIIVIEGLDGSGKNTQSELLFERVSALNRSVRMISVPNYGSQSSGPIKMYLNSEISNDPKKVNPYASSSFFAVDRFINYFCDWKNFYKIKNSLIIFDRYVTSNMIYQLAKMKNQDWDSFLNWISTYEYKYLGLPQPDLVIYLKMPVGISQKLIKKRAKSYDLHESNLKFLEDCQKACDYCAKKFKWSTVNCLLNNEKLKSAEDISNEIFEIVKKIL